MQKRIRKILSLLLTLAMLMQPVFLTGALALEGAKDLDGHWAAAAIEKCHSYGIMYGSDGYYRPGDPITRAEFAAMVNRAFNFTETAGAATFTDVPAGAWYANDIKIASAMGYMSGVGGGKAAPAENITREQAFTIFARVFKLSGNETARTKFSDDAQISSWARAAVNGLAGAGYISGSDGKVSPKAGITRGETAQALINLFGDIADKDISGGTYQNLTIRKAGVTLTDTVINGDLFITDGVGMGDVTLDNVTVKGRTLITGGGPASVKARPGTKLDLVMIDSRFDTHLDLDPGSEVGRINLNSSSSVTHGDILIEYNGETGKLTFGGTIDKITLNQNGYGTATVTIGGVTYDIIPQKTDGGVISSIELVGGCIVGEMEIGAAVDVTGRGKVDKMSISAADVTIGSSVNVDLKKITVSDGVDVSIGGKNYTGDGGPLSSGTTPGGDGGGVKIPVTGVTLNKTALTIAVGDTETLTAAVEPDNASNKSVTWTSSDADVATVSGSGVVSAVSVGTAMITVTTQDGGKTATCEVSVTGVTTGPVITTASLAGGTYGDLYSQTLTATSTSIVIWSIDSGNLPAGLGLDPDTGVISGIATAAGTESFTVKATDDDGESTKALSITVNQATLTFTADSHTIRVNQMEPAYTYIVTGWKFSDSDSLITIAPVFHCPTANVTTPGRYPIIQSTEAAISGGNYAAEYVDGTLTVTEKTPVTISDVTAVNATYDGSAKIGYTGTPMASEGNPSFEYSYRGRDSTVYGPAATAPLNAGDYTVTISVAASDPDYTGSIRLDFTINPKEITITAGTQSRTLIPFDSADISYGTTATVIITVDGLVGSDTVAFDVDTNSYGLSGSTGGTNILTLAYDGTPTGTTTASVGLTLTGDNYTLSGFPTIDVTIYDGGAAARAIPVTQDNLSAFNAYARTDGLSKRYKLTENVTLTPPDSGESNWTAVGSESSPFTGGFDGQGHTITGLTINNRLYHQGMFGYISSLNSTVKNLGLVNVSVIGSAHVGGVAGYINGGTISYCYVTGSLYATSGNSYIGGVAGFNTGTGKVLNCYADVTVTGTASIGGVVGANYGTVQYCYAMGSASGVNNVGGIVGYNSGGPVRYCVALNTNITARTTGNDIRAGRVVGYYYSGTLTNNYAWNGMAVNGAFAAGAADDINGEDLTVTGAKASSAGWPFSFAGSDEDGWKWTDDKMPHLFDGDEREWPEYLAEPSAPNAPGFSSKTKTSVTLTAPDGANTLFKLEYGYSTSSDAPDDGWQDGPTFSNLDPGTTYYFFARYKGSENIGLQASGGLEMITDDYGTLSATDFIVSDDETTYNGAPQGAAVEYASGITVAQAGVITVSYYNESYDSETAPTNAGTYDIMVTTAGGEDYNAISEPVKVGTLTIAKAELTITVGAPSRALIPFDSADPLYGTTAAVNITVSGLIGDDTIDISLTEYGLTLSNNTLIEDNIEREVTLVYDGSTVGSNVAVTPAITLSNVNYTVSAGSTFSVTIYDGRGSGNRAIPVTQANITAFNNYARSSGLGRHYKLAEDVTLTSNWTTIGTSGGAFTGSFDGQGHTISNLTINSSSQNQGMFGYSSGAVKNLGLVNVNIKGAANSGGVVGFASNTVQNCFVTGSVTGTGSSTGGVVGYNNGGTVQYCYAVCSVSSSGYAGGVVGQINSNGTVKNCVALNSAVTTSSATAGRVVGQNSLGSHSVNYAWSGMTVTTSGGISIPSSTNASDKNGADVSAANLKTQAAWEVAGVTFSESGIWVWDENGTNMPSLENQTVPQAWPTYLIDTLGAPADVKLGDGTDGLVTWTDTPNAKSYLVTMYKDDTSTGYTFMATDGVTGVSVLDTMRTLGVGTYYATVIAKAAGYKDSNAAASNAQEIKKLATPTGVSVSESSGYYTVSWTAVTGADTYTVMLYKNGEAFKQNSVSANKNSYTIPSADLAGAGTFTVTVTPRAATTSLYLDGEESSPANVKSQAGTVTVNTSTTGGGGTVTSTGGTYNAGDNVWLEAKYTASTSGDTTTGYVLSKWTVEYSSTTWTVENSGSGWAWSTPSGPGTLADTHVTANGRFIGFTAPSDSSAAIIVIAEFTTGSVIPWVLGGPTLTDPNLITFSNDEVEAYQQNPVMIVDDETTADNKVYFVLPRDIVAFTFSDTSRGGETPIAYTYTKLESDWNLTEALVSTYETLLMAINGTGQSGEALAATVKLVNDISAGGGNRAYAFTTGNAPGSRGLVIDGDGNTIDFGLWFSSGENITVRNLAIDITDAENLARNSDESLRAAVLFEGGGTSSENKLDNCLVWVHASSLEGLKAESVVYIGSGAGATITDCRIIQNSPYGSYAVCTNNFAKTIITDTYMSGGYGLLINDLSSAYTGNTDNIAGNYYFDCAVKEILVLGIDTDAFPAGTVSETFGITDLNVNTYFSVDAWTLITNLYGDTTDNQATAQFDIEFRDEVILNCLNDVWTCTQYITSNR